MESQFSVKSGRWGIYYTWIPPSNTGAYHVQCEKMDPLLLLLSAWMILVVLGTLGRILLSGKWGSLVAQKETEKEEAGDEGEDSGPEDEKEDENEETEAEAAVSGLEEEQTANERLDSCLKSSTLPSGEPSCRPPPPLLAPRHGVMCCAEFTVHWFREWLRAEGWFSLVIGNIYELDLSYQSFRAIPPRLFTVPCLQDTLTVLHLSDNGMRVLDPQVQVFRHLTLLNLRYNSLRTIPREIAAFRFVPSPPLCCFLSWLVLMVALFATGSHLTELRLQSNLLQRLPESICQLHKLRILDLTRNRLATLPPRLEGLEHIEELYLHNNVLEELPAAIGLLLSLRIVRSPFLDPQQSLTHSPSLSPQALSWRKQAANAS